MMVVSEHPVVFFDVDETLVITRDIEHVPHNVLEIQVCEGRKPIKVVPHWDHVRVLRQFSQRGHTVVVWSAGGSRWAQAVVRALDLEDYVDLVMPKPSFYFDDQPPAAWMGRGDYLPFFSGGENESGQEEVSDS